MTGEVIRYHEFISLFMPKNQEFAAYVNRKTRQDQQTMSDGELL